MLSARLVKIIEEHATDMSRSLIGRLRSDGRVATLVRASQDDLEQRAYDVYHNLGRWLGDKSEEAIAHTYHAAGRRRFGQRSEEHTSELQSLAYLVCRLLLEKKKKDRDRRPASP